MELLTAPEVARMLGNVPLGTLRYWRHCAEGPASFRLGRRVVYRLDVVERWIAEQEAADPRTSPAA
jgi:predicted DNA-binding transcriptional regulator AlpA